LRAIPIRPSAFDLPPFQHHSPIPLANNRGFEDAMPQSGGIRA
jgi:hypothetical protein